MKLSEENYGWRDVTRNTAYLALSTGAKAAIVMFVFVATVLFANIVRTL
jgi:hypothetical protein